MSLAFTLLNTHRNSVQKNQKGLWSSCGLQNEQLEACAHLHRYRWEAEFASDLWESTCWALDVSCWEVGVSSASRLGKGEPVDGPCSLGMCWSTDMRTSYWRKGYLPRGSPSINSIYRDHNPHLTWSTLHNEAVPNPQGSSSEDTHSLPPHWGLKGCSNFNWTLPTLSPANRLNVNFTWPS